MSTRLPPLGLAAALIALLASFTLLPWVRADPRLLYSILGAAAALTILLAIVRSQAARRGRILSYQFQPRPVHYVQLAMHTSIYLYWGWYWREVYHYAPLILAQVVFVYVLDMLVCWSRRDKWILGFGPFPIVLSTNLFLWFKDDWFFLQFLLVATGVLCKEFVTWTRDGRRTHIFNPSAIALCLFSIGLIATGSTHISWGEEVAVTLGRPPFIYVEIFLLGLIVQGLFSVTLVTLSAAASLYLLNLLYTGSTGVYYFVDSNIPAAVFLGLHLLVTDPATSPRRSLGKILFGAMYGAGVFGLYFLLGRIGAPTFYDKLLVVPPLNLMVRALDRWAAAVEARLPLWTPLRANFAHMAIWIALFAVMAGTGFVGGRHPGAGPEFWRQACEQGRRNACPTWAHTLDIACTHGSGSACLGLGMLVNESGVVPRDTAAAGKDFARGCDLGVPQACRSLVVLVQKEGQDVFAPACNRGDAESCFVLGSLAYAGRGVARDPVRAMALFGQACSNGWPRGCGALGECYRAAADTTRAVEFFEKACRAGIAPSCYAVATIYRSRKEELLAQERFRQACESSTRFAATNAAYFKSGAAGPAANPAFCSQSSP